MCVYIWKYIIFRYIELNMYHSCVYLTIEFAVIAFVKDGWMHAWLDRYSIKALLLSIFHTLYVSMFIFKV